jgi:hypothetical protein
MVARLQPRQDNTELLITMAFKLAIGNIIEFPVHLKLRDGDRLKDYKFSLQATRIDAAQARDLFQNSGNYSNTTIDEFLLQNITGWRGQTLVVNEDDGSSAQFGPEALAALLSAAGAANTIYLAYLKAVMASNGDEGVRKN